MFWLGVLVGVVAYVGYLAFTCLFRIGEGHVGVVTAFGAAKTSPGGGLRTYAPGLHRKWPWERVIEVSVMEQNLDLGAAGDQSTMTRDGMVLRFEASLRYAPVRVQLEHFLFGVRRPIEHLTGLFTCLLRNEVADFRAPAEAPRGSTALAQAGVDAATSYDTLRRHRQELNARIEAFCAREIGDRYGIRFSAVDLADILPPEELVDALNGVMNAGVEADAHYAHAEADSRQRLLAAARGIDVAKAQGDAVEQEILAIAEHLSELHTRGLLSAYVERRRAEVLSQARTFYFRSHA